MIHVCFVCLGNICRSPTAEGIMVHLVAERRLVEHIAVDSAGTSAYHSGELADARSRETAETRGVRLTSRARQFERVDLARFDYVLAMDHENLHHLERLARTPEERNKVHLLRAFDPESEGDLGVPDPYYGGPGGFDQVFDICMAGCRGLLDHLILTHGLPAT